MTTPKEDFSGYLSDWQKYQTRKEIDFIRDCVQRSVRNSSPSTDPIFVNIGAGAGTSTIAILEAYPRGVVFSIDIVASGSEVYTNEHLRLDESGWAETGRVIRVWGDSKIVGKLWPTKINLLIVDGGHELDEISGDINVWADRVKKFGIIMFHDYNSRHWPKVKEVIDERIISDEKYEFIGLVDTMIAFVVKK